MKIELFGGWNNDWTAVTLCMHSSAPEKCHSRQWWQAWCLRRNVDNRKALWIFQTKNRAAHMSWGMNWLLLKKHLKWFKCSHTHRSLYASTCTNMKICWFLWYSVASINGVVFMRNIRVLCLCKSCCCIWEVARALLRCFMFLLGCCNLFPRALCILV